MTIETKFTAGPFAENDEWTTPIACLAAQILNTAFTDLPAPVGVVVCWPDGDEITYRRIVTDAEAKAWIEGFVAGNEVARENGDLENETVEDEDEELFEFVQVGWMRDDVIRGMDYFSNLFDSSSLIDLGWEVVYKAA